MSLEVFLPCNVLELFQKDGCQHFSKCLGEFTYEVISDHGLCWLRAITDSLSILITGLFLFSISSLLRSSDNF